MSEDTFMEHNGKRLEGLKVAKHHEESNPCGGVCRPGEISTTVIILPERILDKRRNSSWRCVVHEV